MQPERSVSLLRRTADSVDDIKEKMSTQSTEMAVMRERFTNLGQNFIDLRKQINRFAWIVVGAAVAAIIGNYVPHGVTITLGPTARGYVDAVNAFVIYLYRLI